MSRKNRLIHFLGAGLVLGILIFILFTIPPAGTLVIGSMFLGVGLIVFLLSSLFLKKKFALILSLFVLMILVMRILRILDSINVGILSSLVIALFIYFK